MMRYPFYWKVLGRLLVWLGGIAYEIFIYIRLIPIMLIYLIWWDRYRDD